MIVAEGFGGMSDLSVIFRASMGPQLDSCGRVTGPGDAAPPVPTLQWGRNLIVAEGLREVEPPFKNETCFNGAAT